MIRREPFLTTFVVALLLIAIACGRGSEGEREHVKDAIKKKEDPAIVSRTKSGQSLIRIDGDAQRRIGLVVSAVSSATFRPQLIVFGRLEEDPTQTFVLRAPTAGVLESIGARWPSLGQEVRRGQVVGAVLPRLAPAERITLTTQLSTARADAESARASVESAGAAYERARTLNADNKNISDRALEETRVRLETERAKLAAAQQTVGTLERALQAPSSANSVSLTTDVSGVVTELNAHPGESLEAGLALMKISALDRLIARIDLPVGQSLPSTATAARIAPSGAEERSFLADKTGVSVGTDASASPGESYRFRLRRGSFGLRPGMAVTAWIGVPGDSESAYVVPAAAVVRLSGKAYIYVQIGDNEFVRTEVAVLGPTDKGYFVSGLPGASPKIITTGAQTLLSEEFRPASVEEEE